ncbi:unnamed protein product [Parnassius apollo]|uniref:(apollo) hypothetical protein n=1 Tax=Parnassius apollo TaxID=110799 RepID=A0A8S3Y5K9_PARAO|nr:unnamed protein product [Parnassius apollo]
MDFVQRMRRAPPAAGAACWVREDPADTKPSGGDDGCEGLLGLPAFYTIRAATHVQIFSISRKYLLHAIEIPQIKDAIEFAKEQPEYSRLQVRSQPFLSYRPPDPIPNVERFRLPRKHEPDYAFLHPFHRLGFLSVLRYIFPRFTIRPDGEYLMRTEWVRAGCALLSALLFPSYTYLELHANWLYYFGILLDAAAYFDIVQRMLVGYYNEKGILVYHPASTAGHYLRGAFLVDLFACLPLENLDTYMWEVYGNSEWQRLSVMGPLLMLNRLVQLYRLPAAIQGLDRYLRRDIVLVDVLAHYGYSWDKMGGLDYRNVLKLCDQITLRTDAILDIYGSTFAMCPILSQCDVSLLRIIGRAMHSVHFLQNTRIIENDDVINDIFFVDFGSVELIYKESGAFQAVELTKGSIFGELDGAPSFRSPVCLVSLSKVHLLQINATAFYKIISDFPDVVQLLKSYRPNNENYVLGITGGRSSIIIKDPRPISSIIPMRRRKGLFKFLHFNNAMVQLYLVVVSLLCIHGDVYNAGFQDNRILLILVLYLLDLGFCFKFLIPYAMPDIAEKDDDVIRVLLEDRQRYYNYEFKFDVLSCAPLELFSFLSYNHRGMLFSMFRLNRLFRVMTAVPGAITCIFVHYTSFLQPSRRTVSAISCQIIGLRLYLCPFYK